MTESMLHGLMKLFAILASIRRVETEELSENYVESFLNLQFSSALVDKSLVIFRDYLNEISQQERGSREKRISVLSVKILTICDQINREMHVRNKYFILISLIQFSKYFEEQGLPDDNIENTIGDAVKTIAEGLLIDPEDFKNCQAFITREFYRVPNKKSLLVINGEESIAFSNINQIYRRKLAENIYFLHIRQGGLYIFYYSGNQALRMGDKVIYSNHIYIFPKGASLKHSEIEPVYYSDIAGAFLRQTGKREVILEARQISHSYPKSENGIKALSFRVDSGSLMGVMGGSGTGKSTLLKLLSGGLPLHSGEVLINGLSFRENGDAMRSMIGYIPQDDLLIEELSVFDNLYYSARLSLGNLSDREIRKAVLKTLNTLDLLYIRDLKVGSALNKFISGGQRKRLNIALELIREPSVLFADEPISGLSSTDSEKVIQLLKEQALMGKIVLINIHQPSSEIYKMLDSLMILDKGGYPVYFGNPMDAFTYLKKAVNRIDAAEIECGLCGNVQTDELLQVIESKKVDEFGEYIEERMVEPEQWYKMFCEESEAPKKSGKVNPALPEQKYCSPGLVKQFHIYSKRNFLTKIADRQYLWFASLISPLLAVVLGFFTKYVNGTPNDPRKYVFSLNENLPAYLFMAVVVALFVGLIISAEEIIKDRKILARESFLKLSKWSYLNSKILFLFGLTAIQVLLLVIIGNGILGIKGMTWSYWIILFSTAAMAVLLGLNISSAFKSVIAIYINIPFILVPLILLSGVIVPYDKLHYRVSSAETVPVVGDLMASRWAYEALMVNQFKNNDYEVHFFEAEKKIAGVKYELNYLLPEILNQLDDYESYKKEGNTPGMERAGKIVLNSLPDIGIKDENSFEYKNLTAKDIFWIRRFIHNRKKRLSELNFRYTAEKDQIINSLTLDAEVDLKEMREQFYNESIADLVLNRNDLRKIWIRNNKIIRKDNPVFYDPPFRNGRSHFYSSRKRIGPYMVDTVFFNVVVLWMMSLVLYLSLVFNWIQKLQIFLSRYSGLKFPFRISRSQIEERG